MPPGVKTSVMAPRTRTHFNRDRGGRPGPWKHGAIPVIGLIGGIGGGKSLAAAALARRGAFVLDADAVGHALLDQRPVRDRVVERFGTGVLAPSDGPRRAAAHRSPGPGRDRLRPASALCDLETILHPHDAPDVRAGDRADGPQGQGAGGRARRGDLAGGGMGYALRPGRLRRRPPRTAARPRGRGAGLDRVDPGGPRAGPVPARSETPAGPTRSCVNDAGPEALEAAIGRLWETIVPAGPVRSRESAAGRRSPGPAAAVRERSFRDVDA